MKKASVITLGCPKNLVDSENITALLGEDGWLLTDCTREADAIIINTCAFLTSAAEEAILLTERVVNEKKEGAKVVVCGCLGQRAGNRLFNIEGIDGIAGTGDPARVVAVLKSLGQTGKVAEIASLPHGTQNVYPRLLSTFPYAYMKISEGCNNRCSYCLIPALRGKLRSRDIESLEAEALSLSEQGIKELIIVAQDSASYGRDLKNGTDLKTLLKSIVKIDFKWIRIMYLHPAHIEKDLLELIAEEKKICRYLDIPLQHMHPEILKKMNRPLVNYGEIISMIRDIVPGVRLRTTLITGFPQETEEQFRYIKDFVAETRFDMLGVFKYSKEEGTRAGELKGQIKESVKERRAQELMALQQKISAEKLKEDIGKRLDVLVESIQEDRRTGRTEFFAPEIDGTVYIKSAKNLQPGDFIKAEIVGVEGNYDLIAQPHTDLLP